jgi:hypothetical protein
MWKPRRREYDNIKTGLKTIRYEGTDWINVIEISGSYSGEYKDDSSGMLSPAVWWNCTGISEILAAALMMEAETPLQPR